MLDKFTAAHVDHLLTLDVSERSVSTEGVVSELVLVPEALGIPRVGITEQVLDASRMLNSEDIPVSWDTTMVTLHPGVEVQEGPLRVVVPQFFNVRAGGDEIHPGTMLVMVLATGRAPRVADQDAVRDATRSGTAAKVPLPEFSF